VSTELLVGIVLVAVAALAAQYRPRGFSGEWITLSRLFATERRPEKFSHPSQKLFFSPIMPWWIAWSRIALGEYCAFDVELNQEGMWLRYQGPEPRKCADCLFIPWSRIVNATSVGGLLRLHLDTTRNISIDMPPELGAAALRAIA
jgi:hypothetical protein